MPIAPSPSYGVSSRKRIGNIIGHVYELEREKEKLESLIRDVGTDKDLYKAQAEAALRTFSSLGSY